MYLPLELYQLIGTYLDSNNYHRLRLSSIHILLGKKQRVTFGVIKTMVTSQQYDTEFLENELEISLHHVNNDFFIYLYQHRFTSHWCHCLLKHDSISTRILTNAFLNVCEYYGCSIDIYLNDKKDTDYVSISRITPLEEEAFVQLFKTGRIIHQNEMA